jgi:hypothetical protein
MEVQNKSRKQSAMPLVVRCLRGLRHYQFIYRITRTIMGFALTDILFHLPWLGQDLQDALFPFLLMVGVLTAWIAGRPLGWAVSAIYMLISGWGGLLLFDFQIYHGQDFFLWSLGQQETIVMTVILSAYLLIAGLIGWLSGAVTSWLIRRLALHFHGRSS